MENIRYTALSIHNRINAKTGWDIACAYEGQKFGDFKCYTRLACLVKYGVNPNLVGNVYKCYR
jgi:hypothetical protein